MTFASRHGGDGSIEIFLVDKEGVDKVGRSDNVFSHHATNGRRFSVSARAGTLVIITVIVLISGLKDWENECRMQGIRKICEDRKPRMAKKIDKTVSVKPWQILKRNRGIIS